MSNCVRDDIFGQCFGASDGGFTWKVPADDNIFQEFFGASSDGGRGSSSRKAPAIENLLACSLNDLYKGANKKMKISRTILDLFRGSSSRKAPAIENLLACSLNDLYKGANKKMKISRTILDLFSKVHTVEEILTIEIRPGWKKGTKITFPEKGNQKLGVIPADLIFVIDEKPHDVFTRDGNDLLMNQEISLVDALTGKTLQITTLDGRNLAIPVTEMVKPGYELTVPNEGMPISKEPGKKGYLRIKFDVRYPSRLTPEQKSILKGALGGS